jgi:hypothetical protein
MEQITSPEEILALFQAHSECERRMDLEGTMDSVASVPRYELHPLGLEIRGREAVREFYRRTFPNLSARRGSVRRSYSYGERSLAVEILTSLQDDEPEFPGHPSVGVVEFDEEGLVTSERLYYDDGLAQMVLETLGPDFDSIEGVSCRYRPRPG